MGTVTSETWKLKVISPALFDKSTLSIKWCPTREDEYKCMPPNVWHCHYLHCTQHGKWKPEGLRNSPPTLPLAFLMQWKSMPLMGFHGFMKRENQRKSLISEKYVDDNFSSLLQPSSPACSEAWQADPEQKKKKKQKCPSERFIFCTVGLAMIQRTILASTIYTLILTSNSGTLDWPPVATKYDKYPLLNLCRHLTFWL